MGVNIQSFDVDEICVEVSGNCIGEFDSATFDFLEEVLPASLLNESEQDVAGLGGQELLNALDCEFGKLVAEIVHRLIG